MSQTLDQIYTANPSTTMLATDLLYLVHSPYSSGTDSAIVWSNLEAAITAVGTIVTGVWQGTPIALAYGGTNADLTASNGGIFYSTASAGAILAGTATANLPLLSGSSTAPTWGAHALVLGGTLTTAGALTTSGAFGVTFTFTNTTGVTFPTSGTLATTSQIPTGAALTEVNDTNVTLTLGGTPSTALLQATSITAGWTGTLSGARGGTGVANTGLTINLGTAATGYVLTSDSSGNAAWAANPGTGGITTIDGDSGSITASAGVVTISGGSTGLTTSGTSHTLTLTGTLALANGGTSASLTASNGGIFYSTASAGAILAGTATAGKLLTSGASTTPAWTTSTYPLTNAVNTLLYASSANVMAALATANDGVLVTSNSGVPSWLANSGTAGYVLTANTGAPPSWQATSGSGTVNSGTQHDMAYYAATGTAVSGLATANNGVLVTSSGGVPSIGNAIGADITVNGITVGLGASNLTGNTVLGIDALSNAALNTANNVAIGNGALLSFALGEENVAIGYDAMLDANDCESCISIGAYSLYGNSGDFNVGIGTDSLASTSGSNNYAIGYTAFQFLTSGADNIALGSASGTSLLTGSYNALIGTGSGSAYTGAESSNIVIGYNNAGTVSESNVLRIASATGTGSGQLNTAYICGINGNTVSSAQLVTVNTSTNQLGTTVSGIPTLSMASGAMLTFDDSTGTESSNAVTCSHQAGLITTSSLTTAAGGNYAITLTNTKIAGTSNIIHVTWAGGSNTTLPITIKAVCTSANTAVITIYNNNAVSALNGTVIFGFTIF